MNQPPALASGLPFECALSPSMHSLASGAFALMFRRFRRLCAIWLVAQILLPFTAPFPTCDLSDFLSGAHRHGVPLLPPTTHVDGDYAFAPPLATTAGRLRLDVVSSPDAWNVAGIAPIIAAGRPLTAAVGEPEHPQIHPTVLRL